ncbi:hypothetical protein [Streptomyces sp. AGS-58]|uniref:hypothetical protein n=1 Tax=unclassified Streptomyces TaxID=2593676 RepID=UPI0035A315EB
MIFRRRVGAAVEGESARNVAVRRHLMAEGKVLPAHTKVRRRDGRAQVHLKPVLLEPATATVGIDPLPDDVVAAAAGVWEPTKGRTRGRHTEWPTGPGSGRRFHARPGVEAPPARHRRRTGAARCLPAVTAPISTQPVTR